VVRPRPAFLLHLRQFPQRPSPPALSTEETRHVAGEFRIECLVDGRENSSRQQTGDQILGADLKLFGEVLDADSFGDGDAPRNGQRLI
jgi:hypothetical protein